MFQSNAEIGYSGYDGVLLTVYGFLFGNYNILDFDSSSNPELKKFLNSSFLFFIDIVLLNLLIALMGDIFDEVQAKASQETTYGLAKLVLEYESLFSESYKKRNEEKFFPMWLHVISKDEEKDKRGQQKGWKGRTEEIKPEIKSEVAKIDSKVAQIESNINEKFEKLFQQLKVH